MFTRDRLLVSWGPFSEFTLFAALKCPAQESVRVPILCTPVVSTAWQIPSSRTARTPSARMCGCVTWSTCELDPSLALRIYDLSNELSVVEVECMTANAMAFCSSEGKILLAVWFA